MAVYEIFIFFDGEIIYNRPFYSEQSQSVLDANTRECLLAALSDFAENAFNDQMQNFCTDTHQVFIHQQELDDPKGTYFQEQKSIWMYCIADPNSNKKNITKLMENALFQFVNRSKIVLTSHS